MRVLLSCPVFLSKGQTFQQFCTKHTGNHCERIQKRPLFYRIHDVDKKIPDFHAIMWGTFLPVPLRFVPCAKWLTDRCRIFSLHFNRLALHCELILICVDSYDCISASGALDFAGRQHHVKQDTGDQISKIGGGQGNKPQRRTKWRKEVGDLGQANIRRNTIPRRE